MFNPAKPFYFVYSKVNDTFTSKDAIAPAQQTQQGQEVAQESIRRTQTVQANVAAAEQQKIRRKNDDENSRYLSPV